MATPELVDWVHNPSEDLGKDGCVPVPDGPGLGVTYDWDFIEAHKTQHVVFD